MSRIGNYPVPVPSGVTVKQEGQTLTVKGPKGELKQSFRPEIDITIEGEAVVIQRRSEKKEEKALHGLTRALINNMVKGVSEGYEITLLLEGVGYRAAMQGKALALSVGYSHPVTIEPPQGVEFTLEGNQTIKVGGIDKQLVGQVAANIRAKRPAEPYKGKGIRYSTERVRRKAGKAGK